MKMSFASSYSLVAFCFIFLPSILLAQQWEGPLNSQMSIWRNGRIGIGINSPLTLVHLNDTTTTNIRTTVLPLAKLPGTKMRFSNLLITRNLNDRDAEPQESNHSWDLRASGNSFHVDYLLDGQYANTPFILEDNGKLNLQGIQPTGTFVSPGAISGVEYPGTRLRLSSTRTTPNEQTRLGFNQVLHKWDVRALGNHFSIDYYLEKQFVNSPISMNESGKVTLNGKGNDQVIISPLAIPGAEFPGTRLRLTNQYTRNASNPANSVTRNYHWDIRALGNGFALDYYVDNEFRRSPIVVAGKNGRVGIGTSNPKSKLAVNGKVMAKTVEVTIDGWPDFVFAPTYDLMPLSELEQFIQKNGRLPAVPAEQEVIEHGLDLGKMEALLLQKVEELTLYIIELKKENEVLHKRIEALEANTKQ